MKVMLVCLLVFMPLLVMAKDTVILNSGERYIGKLRGTNISHLYIMDTSECLVSVPLNHVRRVLQGDKDVTSAVRTSKAVYSEELLAYYPVPDTLLTVMQPLQSPVVSEAAHSKDAVIIALPIWVLAIVTSYYLIKEKK